MINIIIYIKELLYKNIKCEKVDQSLFYINIIIIGNQWYWLYDNLFRIDYWNNIIIIIHNIYLLLLSIFSNLIINKYNNFIHNIHLLVTILIKLLFNIIILFITLDFILSISVSNDRITNYMLLCNNYINQYLISIYFIELMIYLKSELCGSENFYCYKLPLLVFYFILFFYLYFNFYYLLIFIFN